MIESGLDGKTKWSIDSGFKSGWDPFAESWFFSSWACACIDWMLPSTQPYEKVRRIEGSYDATFEVVDLVIKHFVMLVDRDFYVDQRVD